MKRNENEEIAELVGFFLIIFSFCLMFLPVIIVIKEIPEKISWVMEGMIGMICVFLVFIFMIGSHKEEKRGTLTKGKFYVVGGHHGERFLWY